MRTFLFLTLAVCLYCLPAGAARVETDSYRISPPEGWTVQNAAPWFTGPNDNFLRLFIYDAKEKPGVPKNTKWRKVKPLGQGYATVENSSRGWQMATRVCSAETYITGAGEAVKPLMAALVGKNVDARACIEQLNTPEVLDWLSGKTPAFAELPVTSEGKLDLDPLYAEPPDGWTYDDVRGDKYFYPSGDESAQLHVAGYPLEVESGKTPLSEAVSWAGLHPMKAWQGGYLIDSEESGRIWLTCEGADCLSVSADGSLPDLAPLFAAFKPRNKAGEDFLAVIRKPELMGWLRHKNDLFNDAQAKAWQPGKKGGFEFLLPPGWTAEAGENTLKCFSPDQTVGLEVWSSPNHTEHTEYVEKTKARIKEMGGTYIGHYGFTQVFFTDKNGNACCLQMFGNTELRTLMTGKSEEQKLLFDSLAPVSRASVSNPAAAAPAVAAPGGSGRKVPLVPVLVGKGWSKDNPGRVFAITSTEATMAPILLKPVTVDGKEITSVKNGCPKVAAGASVSTPLLPPGTVLAYYSLAGERLGIGITGFEMTLICDQGADEIFLLPTLVDAHITKKGHDGHFFAVPEATPVVFPPTERMPEEVDGSVEFLVKNDPNVSVRVNKMDTDEYGFLLSGTLRVGEKEENSFTVDAYDYKEFHLSFIDFFDDGDVEFLFVTDFKEAPLEAGIYSTHIFD